MPNLSIYFLLITWSILLIIVFIQQFQERKFLKDWHKILWDFSEKLTKEQIELDLKTGKIEIDENGEIIQSESNKYE